MVIKFRRLLLLTTCALLLAACGRGYLKGSSESGRTNGTSNPSTTGSAFTPSSDARKDVRDALAKLKTAYPYRLTETISALTNGQMTMPGGTRVVEFAAADRSHMKWTGGMGSDVEAISIGNKHYLYSNGKWTERSESSMVERGEADLANKLADMIQDVKYIGPETVNGIACHAYACTFDTTMTGQHWTGTGKVWIGAADGLPHQSDSDLKFGNYSGKSHLVYEYGINVKIAPPAM